MSTNREVITGRFDAGESCNAIARSLGLPWYRVNRMLVQAGRTVPRYTPLASPEMVRDYMQGCLSIDDLAAKYHSNYSSVRRRLLRAGVVLRGRDTRRADLPHVR